MFVQVMSLTEPETWSAAAMYQATRIFASNLNTRLAQRYALYLALTSTLNVDQPPFLFSSSALSYCAGCVAMKRKTT